MISKEKIVNLLTGEETIVERNMSEIEIVEFKAAQAEAEAEAKKIAVKETARAALLAKLGLTEDEAKLLLG
jgi:phosphopantetheinyl transferase (holo-ACP synthase)